MYNQQGAHPEAAIAMDQPGDEVETVQLEIAPEITPKIVQMGHDYVERSDPVITQSQGSTAELINDDQMTSHSLVTEETVERNSEDNQDDESETSSENQSTQSNSRQDEEAARSTGNPQDVEHSESQSLPSSIENKRIQTIRDSDQVATDSGIDQSPDTNQTDKDDQISADGIDSSNLGENAIDARLLDTGKYIVNESSAQLTGVLDPLTADQPASPESSPSSQGTESDFESDATETYPPEESESDSDADPLPDIITGSMHKLEKGKLIMSLPLSPKARKVIKLSENSEGGWKSRLRSTTLVNKTGKNTKETKVSPKRKTRATSSSSSSSCSVQEFRVRDRNDKKPAEKLPTTNATHSNLAAPRRVSTPATIHDIFRREVRRINSKNIHGG